MKSKWIKPSVALAAVTAIALAAYAATNTPTREYRVFDQTSQDSSNPHCQSNDYYMAAKCSSHSSWSRLTTGRNTFSCPQNDNLDYGDPVDTDIQFSYTGTCAAAPSNAPANLAVQRIREEININGTWDCQQGVITPTAQKKGTCVWDFYDPNG